MIKDEKPIQVGLLLVRHTLSSSVRYRASTEHHWHGYLCPWNTPKNNIGNVGKLIEVTSFQQLASERNAYRAEVDLFASVQLAYYEVIDADA